MLEIGQEAPDFDVEDESGNRVQLSQFRGHSGVVLMFYPLDFSPVCTDEHACFVKSLGDFSKLNAEVLGLSVDSVWTHKAFAEKMGITYSLLADFHPRGEAAHKFGMYHADKGITGRAIIIIDKEGKIAWIKNYGFGEAPNTKEVAEALAKIG